MTDSLSDTSLFSSTVFLIQLIIVVDYRLVPKGSLHGRSKQICYREIDTNVFIKRIRLGKKGREEVVYQTRLTPLKPSQCCYLSIIFVLIIFVGLFTSNMTYMDYGWKDR